MCDWLTFTSFRHGDHYLCHVDSINGVISILESNVVDAEGERTNRPSNYRDLASVRKALLALDKGNNICIEFKDSSWTTVQRMEVKTE